MTHIHVEKDIITTEKKDAHFEAGAHTNLTTATTVGSSAHSHGEAGLIAGGAIVGGTQQVIVEKIYEKPVVISHEEKAIHKDTYEGKVVEKHELATEVQTHVNAPIVKEIHQDVIHEHHKDVVVEHHKDVVHEHHQNVVHEHHQPVIVEKHIHEHHQPVIHEKHQTVIEETHVPIVHETHTHQTDKEVKAAVVNEVYEKAVIEETHNKPIVTEVVDKTIVVKEGHTHKDGVAIVDTNVHASAGASAHTTTATKVTESHSAGGHGTTHVHETLEKDGQLLEDEEWVVDEKGEKKKQKRGFFGHLKDKITGHHH